MSMIIRGTVIESKDSDYAYRLVVPRSILASFFAIPIEELDYGNLKGGPPPKGLAEAQCLFQMLGDTEGLLLNSLKFCHKKQGSKKDLKSIG
jgi:hypothetical protein